MTSPAPPAPSHGRGTGPAAELGPALLRYRVMASIVGVLLVVLILVGVPLANFDGTGMWGIFPSTPVIWTEGSRPHAIGEWITSVLGVAHGWLYMLFLVMAFLLARRAGWPTGFTVVTLVCGTIPLLSFWAERRATARVRREHPVSSGWTAGGADVPGPVASSRTKTAE